MPRRRSTRLRNDRRATPDVSAPQSAKLEPATVVSLTPRRRWFVTGAVIALLVLQGALAVHSLVQENPTVDEVIHLPAGITYWQTGSFKLYHHNPPLVKLVAALPVLADKPVIDYSASSWKQTPPNKAQFAHEFMAENAGHYFELFTRARLLMPLFATIGGLVVFAWSARLFGTSGGLLSLALWVLCPNIMAHTRLVTTDVGATSLGILATYLFWRFLHAPTWRLASFAGLALGLAQLTKFSSLVLYGLWPLLAVVRLATLPGPRPSFFRSFGQGLLIVVLSVVVIDVGYGFEGVGIPLGRYEFVCRTLTSDVPPGMRRPTSPDDLLRGAYRYRVNRFRDTLLGSIPVPLPEHYMLGFDDQKLEAEGVPKKFFRDGLSESAGDEILGYPVYLNGELRQESWWYYYLLTLVYKVPEGTWLLVVGSLVVLLISPRSRASGFDEFAVLVMPAFVLFVMSLFTNINLGLRYVLPILPYLYISAGKLAPWASGLARPASRRLAWGFLGASLALNAAAMATIHPHYLAYFNALSGGPDRGAAHLIDSNIDWGQDLVSLRDWLRKNAPREPIGFAYFGQIHPRIFASRGDGFEWFLPPPAPKTMEADALPPRYWSGNGGLTLKSGLYAVSASLVMGLPWRVYESPFKGLEVKRWAPRPAEENAFRYFGELTPFAKIGYSIWLYRVTPEQAERINRRWRDASPSPSTGVASRDFGLNGV